MYIKYTFIHTFYISFVWKTRYETLLSRFGMFYYYRNETIDKLALLYNINKIVLNKNESHAASSLAYTSK